MLILADDADEDAAVRAAHHCVFEAEHAAARAAKNKAAPGGAACCQSVHRLIGANWARLQNQSPLRSSATILIPFLRPRVLTTCSLIGTVRLLRGEMLNMFNTFGVSSALLVVPSMAMPLSTSGEAFSMRI